MKRQDVKEGMRLVDIHDPNNLFIIEGEYLVAAEDSKSWTPGKRWKLDQVYDWDAFRILPPLEPTTTPIKEQNRFEGIDL